MNTIGNLGRPANPATDTITVQGDGQATLPPDVAKVSFTVETRQQPLRMRRPQR